MADNDLLKKVHCTSPLLLLAVYEFLKICMKVEGDKKLYKAWDKFSTFKLTRITNIPLDMRKLFVFCTALLNSICQTYSVVFTRQLLRSSQIHILIPLAGNSMS
jgi:hypothetical protein